MTPTTTRISVKGASRETTFALFDSPSEMARYAIDNGCVRDSGRGGHWADCTGSEACRNAIDGNLQAAEESDKYLSQFESLNLLSRGFETIDNVTGASPNVPNYISGNPMNMRLRRRTLKDSTPLAIVADLTSSGGISNAKVAQRGAAILALARTVSAIRPVELWSFSGLGGGRGYSGGGWFVGCRIDTAPLDLARAAPSIASTAWSRNVGYRLCQRLGSGGSWPYNFRGPLEPKDFETVARVMLPHLQDALAIPGIFLDDPLLANPSQWLKDRIAEYLPEDQAA